MPSLCCCTGSCWAFSSVGAIEALTAIKARSSFAPILSDQELLSCVPQPYSLGCQGGYPFSAMYYAAAKLNGLASEKNYPYAEAETFCDSDKVKTTRDGCVRTISAFL